MWAKAGFLFAARVVFLGETPEPDFALCFENLISVVFSSTAWKCWKLLCSRSQNIRAKQRKHSSLRPPRNQNPPWRNNANMRPIAVR